MNRGDRAEIAVTIRNSSGQIITAPVNVKLYKNGVPSQQSSTSHGRAFFIPAGLGDFTIVVEAAGYKSAQKDVSIRVPIEEDVDIYLQRDLAANETSQAPGKPLLAPKAQEAFTKGSQALREGKLDEAQKYLSKALKLAPGNPDVLYVQGVLYMRQSNWESAVSTLEKSNQIAPNEPRVLAALGMALCNDKKYEQAIPLLEKSHQLEPNSGWESDFALAKAYYYREKYDQALQIAQQAHNVAHTPVPQVELLLAQCLTAVGKYDDSAKVLREFLKSNPQSPEASTAQHWLEALAAGGKIHQ
jgi:tetratricopeptide (TPR) repeat protein